MRTVSRSRFVLALLAVAIGATVARAAAPGEETEASQAKVFRAGAYAIDISPPKLPAIINGGMRERTANKIVDRLHARCLVLDDGQTRIALVVVDSCMVPRELLDEAKRLAHDMTGIPIERMLISATHTHSAPAAMNALGSSRDDDYARFLPRQIAKGIAKATERLAPARIGWGVDHDRENVFCRRYLMKPGTARTAPFTGTENDRAQMNPGHLNPNAIRRTGVVDTAVSVIAVQTAKGEPLAVLGNYSTHYAGAPAISADYFGVFAERIKKLVGGGKDFVGIMSNGASGDANCLDFNRPRRKFDRFTVGESVAAAAKRAYDKIKFQDWVPIAMAERELELKVRLPGEEELARARKVVESLGERKPQSLAEVYAREAVLLSQMPPTRKLRLQAIRLGELGITAIPNEVFGSTGLYLKKHSPFETTIVIELANGAEGYIAPPAQHKLGGYTTWRARTSCLEVQAEPKIVKVLLELLAEVKGKAK